MTDLELLAPARNIDIGIAAIDCGADAVYIAGPAFGARQAAGNSMEDLEKLCRYAHRFGARVFMTLNTILYDNELEQARKMICKAEEIGVDALIVQDLAVMQMAHGGIPLHASTQCAIRDIDTALFYRKMGFSRLVLERQLPLVKIREISHAAECEIEFFVHGALCVCYSGQCYLSEYLAGRSANRGECIQACRSLYDLEDANGKTLMKNKALLSLKDYNLLYRLGDLAEAGVTSFKIEGRLKNMSYVQNTVRAYSSALDELVSRHPDRYRRASFGKVCEGFTPDLDKTFNRGYTDLFIDGKRGSWSSMDTPKGMGEVIGKVRSVRSDGRGGTEITVDFHGRDIRLSNGDGFAFTGKASITGFRGDVCSGNIIRCGKVTGLRPGMTLWRNLTSAFEKEIASKLCQRMISVNVNIRLSGNTTDGYMISASCESEDGRKVSVEMPAGKESAVNQERMKSLIYNQIEKSSEEFTFHLQGIEADSMELPLLSASLLNHLRRYLAMSLAELPTFTRPLLNSGEAQDMNTGHEQATCNILNAQPGYKYNISNHLSREAYISAGVSIADSAYELTHPAGAELMRTRYCIRHELGLCPKQGGGTPSPLFLTNNGHRLTLKFDCRKCEMTVSEG